MSVDGLANDIAETFGMYQKYMGGFADVMNGAGNVTIIINGVQVTVPGQKSLAKKGANSDITSLSGPTTALSVAQGGTEGEPIDIPADQFVSVRVEMPQNCIYNQNLITSHAVIEEARVKYEMNHQAESEEPQS
ncbi:hypothetical protein [Buttiauxella sp. S04-F03]|uniref:phage tail fiber protein n=1 Tax=Buttiauxella sp. S04-F03 TaxID=2904525 RepID=UPI001E4D5022|nr:hypothetical protein [Buttiauxella sp. S04-F03]MCE0812153.1 hypothetical protein [Buttiauxella sp. S04-F03]